MNKIFSLLLGIIGLFPFNLSIANPPKLPETTVILPQPLASQGLSLNFQDISVRAVLQILADMNKTNMIISDSVTGNMSIRLADISWNEALQLILTTQGLAQRKIGNVILIATAAEIATAEKQQLYNQQTLADLAPLQAEFLQINYAKATELADLLKNNQEILLTSRGSIMVDPRTNSIWIQDIAPKLHEIRQFVRKIDIPIRQVLIEARIVLVDNRFEEDLGIRWGITANDHISGTLKGANILNETGNPNEVPVDDRLNVNLPAMPIGGKQPASFGIALLNLGNDVLLDLELSALESEGRGEVISSPRIVTTNQQTASIEKGQEIPFEESTSSGATATVFKKAVLGLKVTPQITADDKIIMHIKVNQDRPNTTLTVKGVPAIDTREIQTQVMVNNGDTLVLGGIYEQETGKNVTRVPFLGNLPGIGYLFSNKQVLNNRSELLVFITPKVITEGTT